MFEESVWCNFTQLITWGANKSIYLFFRKIFFLKNTENTENTENSFYSPDELYTLVYENSYKQYLRLIVLY